MKEQPTILVIFGATGDLVRRKIVPALWHLYTEGALPPVFSVVGFSRRDWDDKAFRAYVRDVLAAYEPARPPAAERAFLEYFRYARGLLEQQEAYRDLDAMLAAMEHAWGQNANKLLYLAVTPDHYQTMLTHIAHAGLTRPDARRAGAWTRIVVEKPFGKDADTAQRLDALLGELFEEEQIYRIDHYLAKEMIQNILAFRFSNNLFEKNWNSTAIERIDLRLWEDIGVEERGAFYDGVGALRDVGQNHLLQMLALVTMERPDDLRAPALRRRRAELLASLAVPSEHGIAATSIRAQYGGYRAIRGVAPDSETETYFKIAAHVLSSRWKGTDITLESGKRMHERRKEIEITFRHPSPCFCPVDRGTHYRNRIVISLEPEERIVIHFWSKKPGFAFALEERTLSFVLRSDTHRSQYVEEYKKLLLDCITGDQTLFVSTAEVAHMWRFIDPISDAWRAGVVQLGTYCPDTDDIMNTTNFSELTPPKNIQELGFVGLGKMGRNMALRLREKGWRIVVYDKDPKAVDEMARRGAEGATDMRDLVKRLARPRLIWLMIPAGKPVSEALFGKDGLASILSRGDTIIDGGNSFYEDTIKRAKKSKSFGIHFLDVGVSGGPEGARHGTAIMIGGEKKDFHKHEDLFHDLAVGNGYAYVGASGAGHFAKMAHNGIEYGMMQAIAEGFALLKKSPFGFDLKKIAGVYNNGSVIESRLVSWLKKAYDEYGENLKKISGAVGHSGEGEWTVQTAKKLKVPAPIIKGAFNFRVKSKRSPSYIGKILSALRNQFGGHSIT